MTPNITDIIRHHVSLEVRCLDRLYLHAYMPKLQTSGGLCYFLHDHLGYRFASPALFRPMHDRFVAAVDGELWAALPLSTGKLCATGYQMNQESTLQPEEEFVFGAFTSPQLHVATQVPIRCRVTSGGLPVVAATI